MAEEQCHRHHWQGRDGVTYCLSSVEDRHLLYYLRLQMEKRANAPARFQASYDQMLEEIQFEVDMRNLTPLPVRTPEQKAQAEQQREQQEQRREQQEQQAVSEARRRAQAYALQREQVEKERQRAAEEISNFHKELSVLQQQQAVLQAQRREAKQLQRNIERLSQPPKSPKKKGGVLPSAEQIPSTGSGRQIILKKKKGNI